MKYFKSSTNFPQHSPALHARLTVLLIQIDVQRFIIVVNCDLGREILGKVIKSFLPVGHNKGVLKKQCLKQEADV